MSAASAARLARTTRRWPVRAVVYKGPFQVAVENVEDPRIEHPNDVIVRLTSTAICGSDLHMYEGRTAAEPGIVFGHENMGIVQEVGPGVVSIHQGDRVVMPFNVACGFCKNCLAGNTAFCLTVNPGFAGGAYGYVAMGPYRGGQAEYLRVPFADFTCLKLPPGQEHEDDFVLLADIFPTGYHGCDLPEGSVGENVAVHAAGRVRRRGAGGGLLRAAARGEEGLCGRPRAGAAGQGRRDRRRPDRLQRGGPGGADQGADRGRGDRQGSRRRRLPGAEGRRRGRGAGHGAELPRGDGPCDGHDRRARPVRPVRSGRRQRGGQAWHATRRG